MNESVSSPAKSTEIGLIQQRPDELPHGLLQPPQEVRDLVAQEKAKFPANFVTAETEGQILNEWTLQYYFENSGFEVAYSRTPLGPDVRAVGEEELLNFRERLGEEEYRKFETWLP